MQMLGGLWIGRAGSDQAGGGEGRGQLQNGFESKPFGFGAEFDAVEAFSDLSVGYAGFPVESLQGDELASPAQLEGGLCKDVFEVGALAGELVGSDSFQRV